MLYRSAHECRADDARHKLFIPTNTAVRVRVRVRVRARIRVRVRVGARIRVFLCLFHPN
jgi:hypothetical protein